MLSAIKIPSYCMACTLTRHWACLGCTWPLWHGHTVLWHTDTHDPDSQTHNPNFSFTFPPSFAQTFWAMLVSHPPCLPSTIALGASNWKRSWGWESSVSSLIPPLGEAHMVSITPTPPRTLGPLSLLPLYPSHRPAPLPMHRPGPFFSSLCY